MALLQKRKPLGLVEIKPVVPTSSHPSLFKIKHTSQKITRLPPLLKLPHLQINPSFFAEIQLPPLIIYTGYLFFHLQFKHRNVFKLKGVQHKSCSKFKSLQCFHTQNFKILFMLITYSFLL